MKTFGSVLIMTLACMVCLPLYAVEVELWPETYFQMQQYRDAERLAVDKTRFTQYLTFNLVESAEVPAHVFQSQFRLDFDLGTDDSADANPNPAATQNLEILYAWYEWRRIANAVDMRIGRQVLTDEFGFYPMDGLYLSVWRDWFVGVDMYAGMEVNPYQNIDADNFKLPNPDNYQPDGVFDDGRLTGVFGGSVFLTGFENTQARFAYRQAESGAIDQQRLGLSFRQELFDLWEFYTIDNFSLYTEHFEYVLLGTELDFDFIKLTIEHELNRPVFDADSIFYFFPTFPHQEFRTAFGWDLDSETRFRLGYSRIYQGDGITAFSQMNDEREGSNEINFDFMRQLGEVSEVHASYDLDRGWGGFAHWFGVGGGTDFWNHRIKLQADWSGVLFDELLYSDMLNVSSNSGFTWGFIGRADYNLHEDVNLGLIGEVYSNRYVSPVYSMFAVLEVHSWL